MEAITSSPTNIFLSYILPLSFSNDLVMNCVLAISGADLCYQETVDSTTVSTTYSHYSLVLRGLQTAVSAVQAPKELLHLLLITLLLSVVEACPTPVVCAPS